MPIDSQALTQNSFRICAGDSMWRANIAQGGQYGFGMHLKTIDAITPVVFMPLIVVITHVPTVFRLLPGWPQFLKSLVELNAIAIDGVDIEYNMDTGEAPAGPNGQAIVVPTALKLNRPSPNMRFIELTGNPIWNFFTNWQEICRSSDTGASTLAGIIQPGQYIRPLVLSDWSMDMALIQFDSTMQPENIIDGYFLCGSFPLSAGAAGYQKQLGEQHIQERNVSFAGFLQRNMNTRAAIINIARMLKLNQLNFNFAQPIATNVESGLQDMGLQMQAAADQTEFTPLVWGGNSALPSGAVLGGVPTSVI